MRDDPRFWRFHQFSLLLLYAAGAALFVTGHVGTPLVRLAGLIPLIHVAEIPMAFWALRGKNASPAHVVLGTLLFGFLWWIPARRGLVAVR
ncbi:MAG: hypothetical protein WCJ30_07810 [Deltaproteobacteria bacterium]